jgi:segregation and condensation protein B
MQDDEAKSVIEAILFMAGEPVTLDTVRKITEIDKYNTERLVRELISDYSVRNAGLFIVEVAEGYQMVTNPACAPWIKKLLSTAVPKKLSQSSLETMAIIAYKQPIIKAEIEAIRGVNSDGVVKTLLDKRLIKILGRKEVPGRPLMYGTTKEFLQYFGLKDLSELPTLKEFQEVDIPEPDERTPEDSGMQQSAEEEQISVAGPVETAHEDTGPETADNVLSGNEQVCDDVQQQEKHEAAVDQYPEELEHDVIQPSDEAVRSQE